MLADREHRLLKPMRGNVEDKVRATAQLGGGVSLRVDRQKDEPEIVERREPADGHHVRTARRGMGRCAQHADRVRVE